MRQRTAGPIALETTNTCGRTDGLETARSRRWTKDIERVDVEEASRQLSCRRAKRAGRQTTKLAESSEHRQRFETRDAQKRTDTDYGTWPRSPWTMNERGPADEQRWTSELRPRRVT
ncbi:hypothetical protein PHYPSEUDO_006051 [Phytophthora pseudosyringae]|uniref:Uncharacterized protein n=1 Tax=Phytophthora pseudosyringae TaxID=221518 RepID=A0A8T1VMV5_9STRA|nr:hypothetical protein PHYPSEUDO_006051 [Phytophthora pseudosyringae]